MLEDHVLYTQDLMAGPNPRPEQLISHSVTVHEHRGRPTQGKHRGVHSNDPHQSIPLLARSWRRTLRNGPTIMCTIERSSCNIVERSLSAAWLLPALAPSVEEHRGRCRSNAGQRICDIGQLLGGR